MKKTILLAALVISASIGSQVASAAGATKVGVLTFALSDTYQQNILQNGLQTPLPLATETYFANCDANLKFVTKTEAINTATVINAIGTALGVHFTSKAQLGIVGYDNTIPAPVYPPYLVNELGVYGTDPADVYGTYAFNGPRSGQFDVLDNAPDGVFIAAMGQWPNEKQIDWVEYDKVDATGDVGADRWPKSQVWLSDPTNPIKALQSCINVTPFFSFEEAFCYFCWDTVDRVSAATLTTPNTSTQGDVCLGGQLSSCNLKGSGTTKWYMTIKFNNIAAGPGVNVWINQEDANGYAYDYSPSPVLGLGNPTFVNEDVIIAVSGVVSYPWTIKPLNGHATAFGTMTMSQANGYGNNPYCGVLTGSVKITETVNTKTFQCLP
jgi:hypothetical protein